MSTVSMDSPRYAAGGSMRLGIEGHPALDISAQFELL